MADDAIEHFVNATGSSVEDAIKYLSICDNNVNLAVECFVEQQPQSDTDGKAIFMNKDEVRAPIESKTVRLVEDQVRVGRVSKRPANAFDSQGERDFSGSCYTNPLAKKKLRGLAELFKPPTDISFVGTLEGAKQRGKLLRKWLLVNLQDVTDFQCQVLNRDLWSKADVRNIIEQHCVFWQLYRDSLEGEHFSRFYSCAASPFIGIIDPCTGELMKHWNFMTKDQFISEMMLFLSEHFSTLQSPVRSPPSKRPCNPRTRGILSEITDDKSSQNFDREVKFITGLPSRRRSTSPVPCSSKHDPSSSKTSCPSSMSLNGSDHDEPHLTPVHASSSTTIINGEIVLPQSSVTSYKTAVSPDKLNLTLRFPDGSRELVAFDRYACCIDLYRWLDQNKWSGHVVWTQFPKSLVPNDKTKLCNLLNCNRALLYVEELD